MWGVNVFCWETLNTFIFTDEEQLRESRQKCGQQKAIIYTNLQSSEETPNLSGVQAKQCGSKSLSSEQAYVKMPSVTEQKKAHSIRYFTGQKVYLHFIDVFIHVYTYIHAKYMSNIFFNIQIYFITPGCQHHTNVLFYIRVCASACPHTGTGRCLWVSINYQLESECKTDTRCPLLSIMISLPLFR